MFYIRLLGTPTIERDGQPLPPFKSRKAFGLLAYLALERGEHSRSHLAGLLWSDCSEDQALANLRYTLWNLNQVLRVSIVQADRTTVELRAEPMCVFDTDEFFKALQQAESNRQGESPTTVAALERAVALYRGDLLAGLDFEGLIGEWLERERTRLREHALEALYRLAQFYLTQHRLPQAIAALRRLLAFDPWREEAHRLLMLALAHSGQHSAALAQYETCRRVLQLPLAGRASLPTP